MRFFLFKNPRWGKNSTENQKMWNWGSNEVFTSLYLQRFYLYSQVLIKTVFSRLWSQVIVFLSYWDGKAILQKSPPSGKNFTPKIKDRRILFFYPNHNYCVAKTGYLADKSNPTAPHREYSILGSWVTGGGILHWPTAYESRSILTVTLQHPLSLSLSLPLLTHKNSSL